MYFSSFSFFSLGSKSGDYSSPYVSVDVFIEYFCSYFYNTFSMYNMYYLTSSHNILDLDYTVNSLDISLVGVRFLFARILNSSDVPRLWILDSDLFNLNRFIKYHV